MKNTGGLSEKEISIIATATRPEAERVVLFGSRARGTHRRGSDVDVAVFGPNVTARAVSRMKYVLEEETFLPYRFDVVDGEHLSDESLRQKILSEGIVL